MSTALNTIMSDIYLNIPEEILSMTFRDLNDTALSLDEHIRQRIIIPTILPRINSVCGMSKHIQLLASYIELSESHHELFSVSSGTLYRIPMEARDNREIIEVRRLTGYPYAEQFSSPNSILTAQADLLASYTYGNNSITTTVPVLKEGNIILVRPSLIAEGVFAECVLGFDHYFTGLPNNAELPLSHYITSILKAYIRNRLIIKIEQGELMGGVSVGRVREIIDQYEQDTNLEHQQNLFQSLRGAISILSKENWSRYLSHAL